MAPPGMAPPPGMAQPPPGVPPTQTPVGAPRGMPGAWGQPPPNMPNINFSAPVIRLGTSGPQRSSGAEGAAGRGPAPAARRGLGMDSGRDGERQMQQLIPPSKEEIARTIFIGNIPAGVGGDEGMERILSCAGHLARWIRATDAHNKPQTFGFAEYGDAQSLETAAEIFKNVEVPSKRQEPGEHKEGDGTEIEKTKLLIMLDDASIKYAEEWKTRRGDDEATTQFRVDQAKEALDGVLRSLFYPPQPLPVDHNEDVHMHDAPTHDADGVEVVNIAFNPEDELADIPAEMREIVAAEIAAFRDRSNRRDQERLRREEEIEAEERRRSGRRSPPAAAPTGPGGAGANGVPLGPRAERGVQGAPSGPRGSQFPRDYQDGVNFVNGGAINNGVFINREDDNDPASDEEIERRRQKKRDEELDDLYKKKLSQWMKHENRNATSLERTSDRMRNEEAEKQKARDAQAKYLEEFDDDAEASRKSHLYYRDHSEYLRQRDRERDRELRDDAADRQQEQREMAVHQRKQEVARGQADAFLEQQAEELARAPSRQQAQPFKLSLTTATKKVEEAAASRRTVAEVENMLDDEEQAENPAGKKRALIPINFDASVRANLTAEEVAEAQQQLAREIPSDKQGLWEWKVSWEHLSPKIIDSDIRKWTEKKVLDIMGIQEDMLVDTVLGFLKERRRPQELVDELEMALDEEAEGLVKKLWRMVIYFSEQEKRGIK
ncbi:hypothetical protein M011DRAFT_420826 [Sporormia fimetaria CBS 119925]|uniref:PWI domain-containing protein n=1 Tax=Sporormia fimetaria CBS 119925 TaxID=1340428 RepID=A0A6A6VFU5_9PLEO|nr:hypothetical protein M011DRAFT_420826 [Sporormia fimetaria CBS 119925]